MTRTCWRPLAGWLALAVGGAAVQGQEMLPMPGHCAKAASCASQAAGEGRLVQKTYPIGQLLHAFGCCPACPDLLIKFMTQCVAPESWTEHGGRGTMTFCPLRMALVVRQTSEVQKQVGALLKAMDKMASVYTGPMSLVPVGLPIPPPPMPPHPAACPVPPGNMVHSPEPKQHFRFALDNLRIRTDDKATVTIKHVEIEYAGDGIDADVAKCAITLGESEKEEGKRCYSSEQGGAAAAGAALGALTGGLTGNAIESTKPADEKAEPAKSVKAEEKSDKAESKKVEEEEDHED